MASQGRDRPPNSGRSSQEVSARNRYELPPLTAAAAAVVARLAADPPEVVLARKRRALAAATPEALPELAQPAQSGAEADAGNTLIGSESRRAGHTATSSEHTQEELLYPSFDPLKFELEHLSPKPTGNSTSNSTAESRTAQTKRSMRPPHSTGLRETRMPPPQPIPSTMTHISSFGQLNTATKDSAYDGEQTRGTSQSGTITAVHPASEKPRQTPEAADNSHRPQEQESDSKRRFEPKVRQLLTHLDSSAVAKGVRSITGAFALEPAAVEQLRQIDGVAHPSKLPTSAASSGESLNRFTIHVGRPLPTGPSELQVLQQSSLHHDFVVPDGNADNSTGAHVESNQKTSYSITCVSNAHLLGAPAVKTIHQAVLRSRLTGAALGGTPSNKNHGPIDRISLVASREDVDRMFALRLNAADCALLLNVWESVGRRFSSAKEFLSAAAATIDELYSLLVGRLGVALVPPDLGCLVDHLMIDETSTKSFKVVPAPSLPASNYDDNLPNSSDPRHLSRQFLELTQAGALTVDYLREFWLQGFVFPSRTHLALAVRARHVSVMKTKRDILEFLSRTDSTMYPDHYRCNLLNRVSTSQVFVTPEDLHRFFQFEAPVSESSSPVESLSYEWSSISFIERKVETLLHDMSTGPGMDLCGHYALVHLYSLNASGREFSSMDEIICAVRARHRACCTPMPYRRPKIFSVNGATPASSNSPSNTLMEVVVSSRGIVKPLASENDMSQLQLTEFSDRLLCKSPLRWTASTTAALLNIARDPSQSYDKADPIYADVEEKLAAEDDMNPPQIDGFLVDLTQEPDLDVYLVGEQSLLLPFEPQDPLDALRTDDRQDETNVESGQTPTVVEGPQSFAFMMSQAGSDTSSSQSLHSKYAEHPAGHAADQILDLYYRTDLIAPDAVQSATDHARSLASASEGESRFARLPLFSKPFPNGHPFIRDFATEGSVARVRSASAGMPLNLSQLDALLGAAGMNLSQLRLHLRSLWYHSSPLTRRRSYRTLLEQVRQSQEELEQRAREVLHLLNSKGSRLLPQTQKPVQLQRVLTMFVDVGLGLDEQRVILKIIQSFIYLKLSFPTFEALTERVRARVKAQAELLKNSAFLLNSDLGGCWLLPQFRSFGHLAIQMHKTIQDALRLQEITQAGAVVFPLLQKLIGDAITKRSKKQLYKSQSPELKSLSNVSILFNSIEDLAKALEGPKSIHDNVLCRTWQHVRDKLVRPSEMGEVSGGAYWSPDKAASFEELTTLLTTNSDCNDASCRAEALELCEELGESAETICPILRHALETDQAFATLPSLISYIKSTLERYRDSMSDARRFLDRKISQLIQYAPGLAEPDLIRTPLARVNKAKRTIVRGMSAHHHLSHIAEETKQSLSITSDSDADPWYENDFMLPATSQHQVPAVNPDLLVVIHLAHNSGSGFALHENLQRLDTGEVLDPMLVKGIRRMDGITSTASPTNILAVLLHPESDTGSALLSQLLKLHTDRIVELQSKKHAILRALRNPFCPIFPTRAKLKELRKHFVPGGPCPEAAWRDNFGLDNYVLSASPPLGGSSLRCPLSRTPSTHTQYFLSLGSLSCVSWVGDYLTVHSNLGTGLKDSEVAVASRPVSVEDLVVAHLNVKSPLYQLPRSSITLGKSLFAARWFAEQLACLLNVRLVHWEPYERNAVVTLSTSASPDKVRHLIGLWGNQVFKVPSSTQLPVAMPSIIRADYIGSNESGGDAPLEANVFGLGNAGSSYGEITNLLTGGSGVLGDSRYYETMFIASRAKVPTSPVINTHFMVFPSSSVTSHCSQTTLDALARDASRCVDRSMLSRLCEVVTRADVFTLLSLVPVNTLSAATSEDTNSSDRSPTLLKQRSISPSFESFEEELGVKTRRGRGAAGFGAIANRHLQTSSTSLTPAHEKQAKREVRHQAYSLMPATSLLNRCLQGRSALVSVDRHVAARALGTIQLLEEVSVISTEISRDLAALLKSRPQSSSRSTSDNASSSPTSALPSPKNVNNQPSSRSSDVQTLRFPIREFGRCYLRPAGVCGSNGKRRSIGLSLTQLQSRMRCRSRFDPVTLSRQRANRPLALGYPLLSSSFNRFGIATGGRRGNRVSFAQFHTELLHEQRLHERRCAVLDYRRNEQMNGYRELKQDSQRTFVVVTSTEYIFRDPPWPGRSEVYKALESLQVTQNSIVSPSTIAAQSQLHALGQPQSTDTIRSYFQLHDRRSRRIAHWQFTRTLEGYMKLGLRQGRYRHAPVSVRDNIFGFIPSSSGWQPTGAAPRSQLRGFKPFADRLFRLSHWWGAGVPLSANKLCLSKRDYDLNLADPTDWAPPRLINYFGTGNLCFKWVPKPERHSRSMTLAAHDLPTNRVRRLRYLIKRFVSEVEGKSHSYESSEESDAPTGDSFDAVLSNDDHLDKAIWSDTTPLYQASPLSLLTRPTSGYTKAFADTESSVDYLPCPYEILDELNAPASYSAELGRAKAQEYFGATTVLRPNWRHLMYEALAACNNDIDILCFELGMLFRERVAIANPSILSTILVDRCRSSMGTIERLSADPSSLKSSYNLDDPAELQDGMKHLSDLHFLLTRASVSEVSHPGHHPRLTLIPHVSMLGRDDFKQLYYYSQAGPRIFHWLRHLRARGYSYPSLLSLASAIRALDAQWLHRSSILKGYIQNLSESGSTLLSAPAQMFGAAASGLSGFVSSAGSRAEFDLMIKKVSTLVDFTTGAEILSTIMDLEREGKHFASADGLVEYIKTRVINGRSELMQLLRVSLLSLISLDGRSSICSTHSGRPSRASPHSDAPGLSVDDDLLLSEPYLNALIDALLLPYFEWARFVPSVNIVASDYTVIEEGKMIPIRTPWPLPHPFAPRNRSVAIPKDAMAERQVSEDLVELISGNPFGTSPLSSLQLRRDMSHVGRHSKLCMNDGFARTLQALEFPPTAISASVYGISIDTCQPHDLLSSQHAGADDTNCSWFPHLMKAAELCSDNPWSVRQNIVGPCTYSGAAIVAQASAAVEKASGQHASPPSSSTSSYSKKPPANQRNPFAFTLADLQALHEYTQNSSTISSDEQVRLAQHVTRFCDVPSYESLISTLRSFCIQRLSFPSVNHLIFAVRAARTKELMEHAVVADALVTLGPKLLPSLSQYVYLAYNTTLVQNQIHVLWEGIKSATDTIRSLSNPLQGESTPQTIPTTTAAAGGRVSLHDPSSSYISPLDLPIFALLDARRLAHLSKTKGRELRHILFSLANEADPRHIEVVTEGTTVLTVTEALVPRIALTAESNSLASPLMPHAQSEGKSACKSAPTIFALANLVRASTAELSSQQKSDIQFRHSFLEFGHPNSLLSRPLTSMSIRDIMALHSTKTILTEDPHDVTSGSFGKTDLYAEFYRLGLDPSLSQWLSSAEKLYVPTPIANASGGLSPDEAPHSGEELLNPALPLAETSIAKRFITRIVDEGLTYVSRNGVHASLLSSNRAGTESDVAATSRHLPLQSQAQADNVPSSSDQENPFEFTELADLVTRQLLLPAVSGDERRLWIHLSFLQKEGRTFESPQRLASELAWHHQRWMHELSSLALGFLRPGYTCLLGGLTFVLAELTEMLDCKDSKAKSLYEQTLMELNSLYNAMPVLSGRPLEFNPDGFEALLQEASRWVRDAVLSLAASQPKLDTEWQFFRLLQRKPKQSDAVGESSTYSRAAWASIQLVYASRRMMPELRDNTSPMKIFNALVNNFITACYDLYRDTLSIHSAEGKYLAPAVASIADIERIMIESGAGFRTAEYLSALVLERHARIRKQAAIRLATGSALQAQALGQVQRQRLHDSILKSRSRLLQNITSVVAQSPQLQQDLAGLTAATKHQNRHESGSFPFSGLFARHGDSQRMRLGGSGNAVLPVHLQEDILSLMGQLDYESAVCVDRSLVGSSLVVMKAPQCHLDSELHSGSPWLPFDLATGAHIDIKEVDGEVEIRFRPQGAPWPPGHMMTIDQPLTVSQAMFDLEMELAHEFGLEDLPGQTDSSVKSAGFQLTVEKLIEAVKSMHSAFLEKELQIIEDRLLECFSDPRFPLLYADAVSGYDSSELSAARAQHANRKDIRRKPHPQTGSRRRSHSTSSLQEDDASDNTNRAGEKDSPDSPNLYTMPERPDSPRSEESMKRGMVTLDEAGGRPERKPKSRSARSRMWGWRHALATDIHLARLSKSRDTWVFPAISPYDSTHVPYDSDDSDDDERTMGCGVLSEQNSEMIAGESSSGTSILRNAWESSGSTNEEDGSKERKTSPNMLYEDVIEPTPLTIVAILEGRTGRLDSRRGGPTIGADAEDMPSLVSEVHNLSARFTYADIRAFITDLGPSLALQSLTTIAHICANPFILPSAVLRSKQVDGSPKEDGRAAISASLTTLGTESITSTSLNPLVASPWVAPCLTLKELALRVKQAAPMIHRVHRDLHLVLNNRSHPVAKYIIALRNVSRVTHLKQGLDSMLGSDYQQLFVSRMRHLPSPNVIPLFRYIAFSEESMAPEVSIMPSKSGLRYLTVSDTQRILQGMVACQKPFETLFTVLRSFSNGEPNQSVTIEATIAALRQRERNAAEQRAKARLAAEAILSDPLSPVLVLPTLPSSIWAMERRNKEMLLRTRRDVARSLIANSSSRKRRGSVSSEVYPADDRLDGVRDPEMAAYDIPRNTGRRYSQLGISDGRLSPAFSEMSDVSLYFAAGGGQQQLMNPTGPNANLDAMLRNSVWRLLYEQLPPPIPCIRVHASNAAQRSSSNEQFRAASPALGQPAISPYVSRSSSPAPDAMHRGRYTPPPPMPLSLASTPRGSRRDSVMSTISSLSSGNSVEGFAFGTSAKQIIENHSRAIDSEEHEAYLQAFDSSEKAYARLVEWEQSGGFFKLHEYFPHLTADGSEAERMLAQSITSLKQWRQHPQHELIASWLWPSLFERSPNSASSSVSASNQRSSAVLSPAVSRGGDQGKPATALAMIANSVELLAPIRSFLAWRNQRQRIRIRKSAAAPWCPVSNPEYFFIDNTDARVLEQTGLEIQAVDVDSDNALTQALLAAAATPNQYAGLMLPWLENQAISQRLARRTHRAIGWDMPHGGEGKKSRRRHRRRPARTDTYLPSAEVLLSPMELSQPSLLRKPSTSARLGTYPSHLSTPDRIPWSRMSQGSSGSSASPQPSHSTDSQSNSSGYSMASSVLHAPAPDDELLTRIAPQAGTRTDSLLLLSSRAWCLRLVKKTLAMLAREAHWALQLPTDAKTFEEAKQRILNRLTLLLHRAKYYYLYGEEELKAEDAGWITSSRGSYAFTLDLVPIISALRSERSSISQETREKFRSEEIMGSDVELPSEAIHRLLRSVIIRSSQDPSSHKVWQLLRLARMPNIRPLMLDRSIEALARLHALTLAAAGQMQMRLNRGPYAAVPHLPDDDQWPDNQRQHLDISLIQGIALRGLSSIEMPSLQPTMFELDVSLMSLGGSPLWLQFTTDFVWLGFDLDIPNSIPSKPLAQALVAGRVHVPFTADSRSWVVRTPPKFQAEHILAHLPLFSTQRDSSTTQLLSALKLLQQLAALSEVSLSDDLHDFQTVMRAISGHSPTLTNKLVPPSKGGSDASRVSEEPAQSFKAFEDLLQGYEFVCDVTQLRTKLEPTPDYVIPIAASLPMSRFAPHTILASILRMTTPRHSLELYREVFINDTSETTLLAHRLARAPHGHPYLTHPPCSKTDAMNAFISGGASPIVWDHISVLRSGISTVRVVTPTAAHEANLTLFAYACAWATSSLDSNPCIPSIPAIATATRSTHVTSQPLPQRQLLNLDELRKALRMLHASRRAQREFVTRFLFSPQCNLFQPILGSVKVSTMGEIGPDAAALSQLESTSGSNAGHASIGVPQGHACSTPSQSSASKNPLPYIAQSLFYRLRIARTLAFFIEQKVLSFIRKDFPVDPHIYLQLRDRRNLLQRAKYAFRKLVSTWQVERKNEQIASATTKPVSSTPMEYDSDDEDLTALSPQDASRFEQFRTHHENSNVASGYFAVEDDRPDYLGLPSWEKRVKLLSAHIDYPVTYFRRQAFSRCHQTAPDAIAVSCCCHSGEKSCLMSQHWSRNEEAQYEVMLCCCGTVWQGEDQLILTHEDQLVLRRHRAATRRLRREITFGLMTMEHALQGREHLQSAVKGAPNDAASLSYVMSLIRTYPDVATKAFKTLETLRTNVRKLKPCVAASNVLLHLLEAANNSAWAHDPTISLDNVQEMNEVESILAAVSTNGRSAEWLRPIVSNCLAVAAQLKRLYNEGIAPAKAVLRYLLSKEGLQLFDRSSPKGTTFTWPLQVSLDIAVYLMQLSHCYEKTAPKLSLLFELRRSFKMQSQELPSSKLLAAQTQDQSAHADAASAENQVESASPAQAIHAASRSMISLPIATFISGSDAQVASKWMAEPSRPLTDEALSRLAQGFTTHELVYQDLVTVEHLALALWGLRTYKVAEDYADIIDASFKRQAAAALQGAFDSTLNLAELDAPKFSELSGLEDMAMGWAIEEADDEKENVSGSLSTHEVGGVAEPLSQLPPTEGRALIVDSTHGTTTTSAAATPRESNSRNQQSWRPYGRGSYSARSTPSRRSSQVGSEASGDTAGVTDDEEADYDYYGGSYADVEDDPNSAMQMWNALSGDLPNLDFDL